MDLRDVVFNNLEISWIKNNYTGYARIGVGCGKSKMMINLAKKHIKMFKNPKILILVPTQNLRDSTFIAEVVKWWNIKEFEKYCTIKCYQSQMKVSNENYTLGLFDEWDSIAEKQLEGITNNTFDQWLGLSGTYTDKKFDFLNRKDFSFIYDYPTSKAQEDGIINKANIYLYPVPLYIDKNIKNSRSYWSEAEQYKWLDTKIDSLRQASYDLYNKWSYDISLTPEQYLTIQSQWKDLMKQKERLESSPSNPHSRMNVTYNLKSITDFAKNLSKHLLSFSNNKVLVFAQRLEQLEKICGKDVYAGKSTLDVINRFNSGKIRLLGGAKKLERGVNFKNLNQGIFHSFSSNQSETLQRLGRLLRLPPDETADLHILISYYISNGTIVKCRNYVWFKNVIDALGLTYTVVKEEEISRIIKL